VQRRLSRGHRQAKKAPLPSSKQGEEPSNGTAADEHGPIAYIEAEKPTVSFDTREHSCLFLVMAIAPQKLTYHGSAILAVTSQHLNQISNSDCSQQSEIPATTLPPHQLNLFAVI